MSESLYITLEYPSGRIQEKVLNYKASRLFGGKLDGERPSKVSFKGGHPSPAMLKSLLSLFTPFTEMSVEVSHV